MLSSDRIRGPTRFGKALKFFFSPSFLSLHKERLAQWPAFCDAENGPKIPGGGEYFQKNWVGCAACFLKPLPYMYFRPKSVIFPALFQT